MDWHLEDVGKIVKMTKVCCGARRVKLEQRGIKIGYTHLETNAAVILFFNSTFHFVWNFIGILGNQEGS